MDFSLVGMWKSMGLPARLVVITLAIMSVYSLSVMAERLFSFSRAKDQSRKYAEKLRDLLPGHQMLEAAQYATTLKYGHIPRVLGAGISEYNKGREALSQQGPLRRRHNRWEWMSAARAESALTSTSRRSSTWCWCSSSSSWW